MIGDNLAELWALFDWLVPGLLGNRAGFGKEFRTPIERHGDRARQRLLSARVQPFLLRRNKEEVAADLPPKTEISEVVPLEGAQRKFSETLRMAMDKPVFVYKMIAEGTVESAIQVMQEKKQALADALFGELHGDPLALGEETLGTANSHELFLAAYRDWPNASRWTPWAGVGVGVAWARKDFSWVWARSANPADILTGAGQPNAAEIRSNLSGTVSTGRAALKDRMTGYLVATGIDRALTESLTLGLKLQWKSFGDFESDAYKGSLLRSHAPNLRLDGSEPVYAWSRTEDTARASVMLSLRYALR